MNDDPDESFVIDTILRHRPQGRRSVSATGDLGLFQAGDDAARTTERDVVTVDAMVQGVHFRVEDRPEDIGWKLVAVNASDVAAMGCRPTWGVVTVSIPSPLDRDWITGFARGLGEALRFWEIHLVGGDTTGSPGPIALSMTLAGTGTRIVSRSGANIGDVLWVTGALGEAAAGFADTNASGAGLLHRPRPPVRFGAALATIAGVTAMMDLSDGLGRDLARMCRASQVSADIDPDSLPRGPSLLHAADPLPAQVAFGEDYQLLFAAHPDARPAIEARAAEHKVRVSVIGSVVAADGHPEARLRGRDWPAAGWSHFSTVRP
jgi:thiamine-monophosphate kinase